MSWGTQSSFEYLAVRPSLGLSGSLLQRYDIMLGRYEVHLYLPEPVVANHFCISEYPMILI